MNVRIKHNGQRIGLGVSLAFLFVLLISSIVVFAAPEGATVTTISNSTKGTTAGTMINATGNNTANAGGMIFKIRLTATQQNTRWKAYVGNITGSLTLDDASGNSIYQWALSTTTLSGE